MKSIFSPKSNFKFYNPTQTTQIIIFNKMNSKSNNNKTQIYSAKKSCCKVCKDAGKSENEYSNHFVKDLNGKVTCPTLLNQECRFCHELGHTTSHCTKLQKIKKSEENFKKLPIPQPKKEVRPQKKQNVFAYLEMNSSDEESEDEQEKTFPILGKATSTSIAAANNFDAFAREKKNPIKFSYASMAAKTETEYVIEQIKETKTTPTPYMSKNLHVNFISKPVSNINKSTGEKITWANCESDSSGDEEDEEYAEEY